MTIETQLQAGWGFIPSECKCLNKKAEDFNLVRQGSISVHRRKRHPQKVQDQSRKLQLIWVENVAGGWGKQVLWVRMDDPMIFTRVQLAVPLALDLGLPWKTNERIELVTWSRSGWCEGEAGTSHLFTLPLWKRKKPSPIFQAAPADSSSPVPADLQQDDGPPEARQTPMAQSCPPAELMAQALLAREQRAINVPEMLLSRSVSCTQAAHCKNRGSDSFSCLHWSRPQKLHNPPGQTQGESWDDGFQDNISHLLKKRYSPGEGTVIRESSDSPQTK